MDNISEATKTYIMDMDLWDHLDFGMSHCPTSNMNDLCNVTVQYSTVQYSTVQYSTNTVPLVI